MAARRMFSRAVIETDNFLDLPLSAQALYFHFGLQADDDGFLGSPQKVRRMIGATLDDFRLLIAKGFVLEMGGGVVVITHWRLNNSIKSDRYTPTIYTEQKAALCTAENGAYSVLEPTWNQDGTMLEPQIRLGKSSKAKGEADKPPAPPKSVKFIPPSVEEVREYCTEKGFAIDAARFVDFYSATNWMRGKNKIKDWKACVRTWVRRDAQDKPAASSAADYHPLQTETFDWRNG